jgi:type II secretory pathway pseudopilin PulG
MKFQMPNYECRISDGSSSKSSLPEIRNSQFTIRNFVAFTLIEVMVVVVLLSFIVLALMTVFNSTQKAFRASVTQTDVLEGGRAAMDFMAEDIREMSASFGQSNNFVGAVNFYATSNANYQPLVQSLIASANSRTNILESFFILNHENLDWRGIGYVVVPSSPNGLYSLYRFQYPPSNSPRVNPAYIFTNQFQNFLNTPTNYSHLMDGVVHLTVRAFDTNGVRMTVGYTNAKNVFFMPQAFGENGFYMFSNTLPSSVEIEMGVLEDRTLQRAESLSGNFQAQSNYLAGAAGQVHIFRQRVSIPNVDPSAYQ